MRRKSAGLHTLDNQGRGAENWATTKRRPPKCSGGYPAADVGDDTVKGGAGDDILFGDAMNTDWITGLDPLQYPQYSGYSKLIAHLEATVTGGAEPTQQQIYDFVKFCRVLDFVLTFCKDLP